MGVPAFFRWLSNKYARIIVNAVEEQPREVNGVTIPINNAAANPMGVEFDNLYLDMNGIIHPCTHPEDRPAPRNEDEMMAIIFEYIDRIFSIIRPRKVLYMAIDGVAPRAKMNQQRSRRFRAAREAQESAEEIDKVRKELELNGIELPPKKTSHFDSNVITPGTEFMDHLAECLKYYVHDRLNNDPGWRGVKVILSDASVPGEGEHKIMEYIRRQRASPGHNPNTRHVLYGADADLIMLGLATHEPYFTILREEFQPNQPKPCTICGQMDHDMYNCQGKAKVKQGEHDQVAAVKSRKEFITIRLHILREYLEKELHMTGLPFQFDIERAIDDWVFMCFFVGNDFLPHLPSLEIREGAIDRLVTIYKRLLPKMGGFITDSGEADVHRTQMVLSELGTMEDSIFQSRQERELRNKSHDKRRKIEAQRRREAERDYNNYQPSSNIVVNKESVRESAVALRMAALKKEKELDREANRKAADDLRKKLRSEMRSETALAAADAARMAPDIDTLGGKVEYADAAMPSADGGDAVESEGVVPMSEDVVATGEAPTDGEENAVMKDNDAAVDGGVAVSGGNNDDANDEREAPMKGENGEPDVSAIAPAATNLHSKRKREEEAPPKRNDDDDESEVDDEVRLWEAGWKDRYYESKFNVSSSNGQFVKSVARAYLEGLCWVLAYYYQGCPSWKWFYPFHYAPFASDLNDLGISRVTFERKTRPFKPIEQLMGVFPAASGRFLPPKCIELMTRADSPIIDFYPTEFAIDLNGKKAAWQGVALLPFIDEQRLLAAMHDVYASMSPMELKRNELGDNILHVSVKHPLFESLCKLYESPDKTEAPIDHTLSAGMGGTVLQLEGVCLPGSVYHSPLPHEGMKDIENNQVISVIFRDPVYPDDFIFPARLLPGVAMPARELTDTDHKKNNGSFNNRNNGNSGNRVPSGPYQQRNPSYDTPAGRMIRHGTNAHAHQEAPRDHVSGGYRDSRGYYEDGYRANLSMDTRPRPQQPYYGGGAQGGYGGPPPSGAYGQYGPPPHQGGYPPQYGNYPPQGGYAQYGDGGQQGGYYGYPPQGAQPGYGNPRQQQYDYGAPPPQRPPVNLAWSRNVASSQPPPPQSYRTPDSNRYDSRNPTNHPYGGSYAPQGQQGHGHSAQSRDPRRR
eukprot:Opistho-2@56178